MATKLKAPKSAQAITDAMVPVLLMQQVTRDDIIQRHMSERMVFSDSIQKRSEQQASVMAVSSAEASEKSKTLQPKSESEKKESKDSSSYAITYYNPELKKAEVLVGKTDIRMKNEEKAAEESVSSQSMFPIYSYIAEPLIRKEVDPIRLEHILSDREYGTPPTSGAGASVIPVRLMELKEKEASEIRKADEFAKASFETFVVRKEKCEIRIGEQILVLEHVVQAIRGGDAIDKAINSLPPLSKARYILLMRKKRVATQIVIGMLLRDISFLKNVKKKLLLFTPEDVLGMVKGLRALLKK